MVTREWYDEDNNNVYYIRFVKVNDVWYAVLKDICDALGLTAKYVAERIDDEFLLKRVVPSEDRSFETTSPISGQHRNGYKMLLVNEMGIYQCIDGSRKLEARKFRRWYPQMISKLRQGIGLPGFMAMEMMDKKVQKHVDEQLDKYIPEFDPFLDNIYYDEKTGKLMQSITVAGGDVEQVEYTGDIPYPYNLYSFN